MRSGFDTFLLAYIAAFFVLEAVLLRRRTWLGRAMLVKCVALASLFAFAAAAPFWGWLTDAHWTVLGEDVTPTVVLRVMLATAITAAVSTLLWYRIHGIPYFEDEQAG